MTTPPSPAWGVDPTRVESTWFGSGFTTQVREIVAQLIPVAGAIVRSRVPGVDASVAAGTLDVQLLQNQVVTMIHRVLRNTDGLKRKTVGGITREYDPGQAASQLVVTDEELGSLVPAPPADTGFFSGLVSL